MKINRWPCCDTTPVGSGYLIVLALNMTYLSDYSMTANQPWQQSALKATKQIGKSSAKQE